MKGVFEECKDRVKDKYCVGSLGNTTDFPGENCLVNRNCEVVVLAFKNNNNPIVYVAHKVKGTEQFADLGAETFVAFTNNAMDWKQKESALIADDLEFEAGTTFFSLDTGNAGSANVACKVMLKGEGPYDADVSDSNVNCSRIQQFSDGGKGSKYTLAKFGITGMIINKKTDLNKKVVISVSTYSYKYKSSGKYTDKDIGKYIFATRISDIPPSKIWEADYSHSAANLTWLWVILAIAFILLLILLIWCLLRRRKQPKPVSGADSEATLRSKMPSSSAVSKNPGADAKSTGSKASVTVAGPSTASGTPKTSTASGTPKGSKEMSKATASKTSSNTASKTSNSKV